MATSNDSFIVAVISPDRGLHEEIAGALENTPEVQALWALSDYPEPDQLKQISDAPMGCIVFLDFYNSERAKLLADELDRNYPAATTVAIDSIQNPQDLVSLMRLGIREVLRLPVSRADIARAVSRASRKLRVPGTSATATAKVCAFLPAKPGSGATTLATHTAAAVARVSGHRTLLIDFDLRLGMTSFLLQLDGRTSVMDALDAGRNLDDQIWERLVCSKGQLDILGSAPAHFGRDMNEHSAGAVIDYALPFYPVICVDLPGNMQDHELDTFSRAQEIFLVCSQELGALHMAKRKVELLRQMEVRPPVSVILNRVDRRGSMPVADIEEILGAPVRFSVVSDDKQITAATQAGVPLDGRFPIVSQIENLARHILAGLPVAETKSNTRRFIELFSVSPENNRMAGRR